VQTSHENNDNIHDLPALGSSFGMRASCGFTAHVEVLQPLPLEMLGLQFLPSLYLL
jgi:hypothetical protein